MRKRSAEPRRLKSESYLQSFRWGTDALYFSEADARFSRMDKAGP